MFKWLTKKNIDNGLDKIDYSINIVESKILPASKKLEEISDNEVVEKINKCIPKALEISKKTISTSKAISKVFEIILSKNETFNVINKNSDNVSDSISSLFNNASISGGLAALSIGVMLISIYQTHRVSKELKLVSKDINSIHNFQLVEYHNSVKSLVFDITNILENKNLLFKKKEIRLRELSNLDQYEHECERLLGQALDMIDTSMKKEHRSFDSYIKITTSINEWRLYLDILTNTLRNIAELKYALNLGSASEEYCFNKYKKIYRAIDKTRINLSDWHHKNADRFEIDFDNKKYRKDGIGLLFKKISQFDKSNKIVYGDISDNDISIIKEQLDYIPTSIEESNDKVVIYIKDGKYYFGE
jgi:hypothetical protein